MQADSINSAEVEAAVEAAIGDILKEGNPAVRFAALSHQLAVYDRVVGRIADERARCATDLNADGVSLSHVAGTLAVGTRARAQQLVDRGRRLPGVIFAFRDQAAELHGDYKLLSSVPYESAKLDFQPADRDLAFAGQLLTVYYGEVDEEGELQPSMYAYATVGALRIRPTRQVQELLFGTRR